MRRDSEVHERSLLRLAAYVSGARRRPDFKIHRLKAAAAAGLTAPFLEGRGLEFLPGAHSVASWPMHLRKRSATCSRVMSFIKDAATGGRRPPLCAAPPSWGRHPKTFTNSDVGQLERHVRSTLNSRRRRTAPACPDRAITGLMHAANLTLVSR